MLHDQAAWADWIFGVGLRIGDVAQLVEHLLCKQGVVGSIPSISTSYFRLWVLIVYGEIEFRFFGLFVPEKVGRARRSDVCSRLNC